MNQAVPFMIRKTYHATPMAMMDAHHFQSHSQRGPLGIWFASRSFIRPSNPLYIAPETSNA